MAVTIKNVRESFDFTEITLHQEKSLRSMIKRVYENSPYYRRKLDEHGIKPGDIRTIKDLASIPFTTKSELREAYPLGMMAVSEEQVVRIHSSSGTTGKPVIIPYTRRDVEIWAEMMARCMSVVGVTNRDRVQITPGYGLWTAGIGFQAGVERIGSMAVPTGPGNTEKQLEMMVDLQSTVLIGTSSYGLLLSEEICRCGIKEKLVLRLGIFGSERWGDKMRARIEKNLGIKTYDIYGLTEIYGPGIAIDCPEHNGLHYWSDHLLFEIIDPITGEQLPPGEQGELVITTLTKEGMPLLRYRTHDITRIKTERCSCNLPYPLIDRILGRSDDMVKVKGVNVYPGQIDHVLKETPGAGGEYQLVLTREQGKDKITVRIEIEEGHNLQEVTATCQRIIKSKIGILAEIEAVPYGELPRSEKKSKRIFDKREQGL
ncbi:phenylacetate-CoA ligase [Desulfohalotomaculum tongense]|uniref:phenylacetate--CoA ligase family protein n=1 Tax=Desulforadius tongensis TaxID=1216062 RepID=UPI00195BFA8F|nr:phenylacetate--CoA ligase [Desulforadius tongensis]MBM7854103.1 phenylacetate-CoA ligase [Desulforadius tongensis]